MVQSSLDHNTAFGDAPLQAREPVVHIIVLNWNGWQDTEACVRSLQRLRYAEFRIVVVDNASADGSEAKLRVAFPELDVLQTGANLGYAGGNNVGIRHAIASGADYVWLLNPDTRVDPSALTDLMAGPLHGVDYGAVASQNTREEGWNYRVAFTGEGDRLAPIECDGCVEAEPYHEATLLQGASLLMSVAALRQVGLIDESYFHYYEDKDIMERIRRAGWRLGFACRAKVVHTSGKSLFSGTPQGQYYELRNRLLYRRKIHGESVARALVRQPRLLRNALSVRRALQLDFRYTVIGLSALFDAARGRGGRRDFPPSYG